MQQPFAFGAFILNVHHIRGLRHFYKNVMLRSCNQYANSSILCFSKKDKIIYGRRHVINPQLFGSKIRRYSNLSKASLSHPLLFNKAQCLVTPEGIQFPGNLFFTSRYYSEKKPEGAKIDSGLDDDEKNLSLIQKFKLMYKRYWYVLIPVHCVTSVFWFGSFFIAAKSGVDIVPLLENLGVSEKLLCHLRDSNAGYYAMAYGMYKVATPARYTVTVGGTTLSITYLKNRGYIKPVPTKDELKELYHDKKDELKEKTDEMKEKYQERREDIIEKYGEKRDDIIEKYGEKRDEIKERYHDKKDEIIEKYRDKADVFREKYLESDKDSEKKPNDNLKKTKK